MARAGSCALMVVSVVLLLLINRIVRQEKGFKTYQVNLINMICTLEAIYVIINFQALPCITAGYYACYFYLPLMMNYSSATLSGRIFGTYGDYHGFDVDSRLQKDFNENQRLASSLVCILWGFEFMMCFIRLACSFANIFYFSEVIYSVRHSLRTPKIRIKVYQVGAFVLAGFFTLVIFLGSQLANPPQGAPSQLIGMLNNYNYVKNNTAPH